MFSDDDVRNLSPQDRRDLIRILARLHDAERAARESGSGRRRALLLVLIVVCCLVLAAWIGVLAVSLPRYYRTGGWRGAWVGFDVALLAAFAMTGWAAWKRRQLLIICLVVLATLLCCDAWFDVVLDARTSGFWLALATAVLIELPLAALAVLGARRLLRLSLQRIALLEGHADGLPSLRKTRLLGAGSTEHLLDLFPVPASPAAAQLAAGPGGEDAGPGQERAAGAAPEPRRPSRAP